MSRRFTWEVALAVVALGLLLGWPASARDAPRRLALVVGANDGGAGRARLRFAHSDARAFARVLIELGGVRRAEMDLLLEPDRARLLSALARLTRRLQLLGRAGRVEVILYYSGHSDEQGLLLAGQRLSYSRLRRAVDALRAEVRVVVLDSCASGALSMLKGGRRRPPYLHDRSSQVRGRAFLTSASAHEGAQESGRLGGSFFTHALISALRGAADINGDRRVTLGEAYQHAYHETLRRTESSRAGAQHAQYDFQLSGAGDLVLTDLRRISAWLELDAPLRGRVYIRDSQARLVAELNKAPGHAMPFGLPAGTYDLLIAHAGRAHRARVTLRHGRHTTLSRRQLKEATQKEATTLRGSAPRDEAAREADLDLPVGSFPWSMESFGFQLGLVNFAAGQARGLQVGVLGNMAWGSLRGTQVSPLFNYARRATGLQVGLVNIAGEGSTVGQVGLVNYVADGRLAPTIWWSGTSYVNLGLRMGGKVMYGLLGAGLQPDLDVVRQQRDLHFSLIVGLGAHLELPHPRLYLDIDLVNHLLLGGERLGSEPGHVTKLRALLGVRFWRRLSVYAGPTLDMLSARGLDRVGEFTWTLWDRPGGPGGYNHRLGLSFVIGLQWEPEIGRLNELL